MTEKIQSADTPGKNWFLYFCAASVNLLAISTGSAYSWTSPAFPVLYNFLPGSPLSEPITRTQESWIAALLSLGAACGPIVSGICADRIGRKRTLILFSFFITVSYVVIAFTSSVTCYLVTRFTLGIGCGCMFTVVPMYVGEIAENSNRGVLGCLLGVGISAGVIMCYIFGPIVSLSNLTIICVIPSVLFLVSFCVYAPETPYYLVSVNDRKAAMLSLMRLRKKSISSVEKELLEIERYIEECTKNKGTIRELVRSKRATKALVICVGTMFFQQFAGITAVLSFLQTIFDASGSSLPGDISSIAIGSLNLIVNVIASQLVDRVGRKILFLISSVGSFISLAVLGTFFFLKESGFNLEIVFWLPIVSLGTYIISYNIGFGPLAWAVAGEMFPSNLKSICSTITASSCLLMAFLITVTFPIMVSEVGIALTLWSFSFICCVSIVFFGLVLPETKGKSFEEIQCMLGRT